MYTPELAFCCRVPFLAPGASQTTYFHFLWFFKNNNFHEFVIWFWAEHYNGFVHESCSGADYLIYLFRRKLQQLSLPKIFMCPTAEHHFWSRHVMAAFISGALVLTKQHFKNCSITLSQHDIVVILYQIITFSDHLYYVRRPRVPRLPWEACIDAKAHRCHITHMIVACRVGVPRSVVF